MKIRILCRVITFDQKNGTILLVRNKGVNWWCAPGGGWDYSKEGIVECAEREVFEETGIKVRAGNLLYAQTLFIKKQNSTWLEHFWLAIPENSTLVPKDHIDRFGLVDEAKWVNQKEIKDMMVYPKILKKEFWDNLGRYLRDKNRYIGHFIL
ncbi:MAG: NUDIX hydrolase [Smithella sp.]|nr:NUDIX hydrolase [Smithella sp.]MDD5527623.1 NUDIX hydrolase [Patescibacteria group bacterium]